MRLQLRILALVPLLTVFSINAQQNDAAEPNDELVVYGTRLVQPEAEVGSSVSVITADDISAMGFSYALDAIASAPGVTINQNGSFGGSASVRIRGASSEQTLVIIDGVVANDPSSPGGGYNFARLDPSNIARIEILKGPQSTLWGTDAIGGVVNILTKRPTEVVQGNAFAEMGSFSTQRFGASIGGAASQFDYRFAAINHSSDGISKADEDNGNSEEDPYDGTTLSATAGFNFGDARLQANVLWTDAEAAFDSFAFGAQGNVADGDELSATEELSTNISLQLPLFDGRLENTFLIGRSDIERENFNAGTPSFSSEGDRTTFRYQGNVTLNDSHRIAFGAEKEDSESNGEDTSIDGIFAIYEAQPTDALTLTFGLRRDDHERFGGETTSRIAAAYNPTDQVTLRASWGEGFKAPTLFQTTFFCCGATEANPNLQPESSDAFDVGITLRTADAAGEVSLTYFDQDTTNLITFSFGIGGYENIATATSSGFELESSYAISDWLGASLSYANIDAKDGTGARLVRVPEHSADLTFSVSPEGPWSGSVLLRYNGEEQDPNGVVDSWSRVDLTASFDVNESLALYARLENLLDEDYQQIIGYGTPGRSGFLGARFSF